MNKQVRITRAQHSNENPYFLMARATAQDSRLSFEARGLLAYLLSKPDGWEVKVFDLTQNCGENRVYRILKELRSNGYMTFQRTRGEDGHFNGGVYQVYETPRDENPDVDNPDVENSRVENRDDLYKTDGEEITDLEIVKTATDAPTPEPLKAAAVAAAIPPAVVELKIVTTPEAPKFDIITLYQNSYGFLVSSPKLKDELIDLEKTYPQDWLEDAFKKAALAHAKNLGYVIAILEAWARDGKNADKPASKVITLPTAEPDANPYPDLEIDYDKLTLRSLSEVNKS